VANLALRAQAVQRFALGSDRAQPQLVLFSRSPRLVVVFGDLAGGRVLLAHHRCRARPVAIEAVECRLHDGNPRAGNFPFDGAVVLKAQQTEQRPQVVSASAGSPSPFTSPATRGGEIHDPIVSQRDVLDCGFARILLQVDIALRSSRPWRQPP
jgi:hypothetical protein